MCYLNMEHAACKSCNMRCGVPQAINLYLIRKYGGHLALSSTQHIAAAYQWTMFAMVPRMRILCLATSACLHACTPARLPSRPRACARAR